MVQTLMRLDLIAIKNFSFDEKVISLFLCG